MIKFRRNAVTVNIFLDAVRSRFSTTSEDVAKRQLAGQISNASNHLKSMNKRKSRRSCDLTTKFYGSSGDGSQRESSFAASNSNSSQLSESLLSPIGLGLPTNQSTPTSARICPEEENQFVQGSR